MYREPPKTLVCVDCGGFSHFEPVPAVVTVWMLVSCEFAGVFFGVSIFAMIDISKYRGFALCVSNRCSQYSGVFEKRNIYLMVSRNYFVAALHCMCNVPTARKCTNLVRAAHVHIHSSLAYPCAYLCIASLSMRLKILPLHTYARRGRGGRAAGRGV